MKKGMLIGLIVGIAVMAALFAIPALAQNPSDDAGQDSPPINQGVPDTWQNMWNACQSGDWDAMADAAEEFHGSNYGVMPCYGWSGTDDAGDTDGQNQGSGSWWQGMGNMMNSVMGGNNGWGNVTGNGSSSGSWSGMGGMMGW